MSDEQETRTRWFTFGWGQAHHVAGLTFDPNIAVEITAEDPRARMVELFGMKWGMEYDAPVARRFAPRGIARENASGGFDVVEAPDVG